MGRVVSNDQDAARAAATEESSPGSLWRRWDPHVHLPGTVLNDQFGAMTVAEALEALGGREPGIGAIGVTDYLTTASYRRAADALCAGVAPSIRFAFPNVELRLDNATSADRGVNVHLLCAPEEVDRLDHFLGGLEFSWSERTYRADRAGLVSLGRDYANDPELNEPVAFKAGVEQFKVNFEDLRRRLRNDRWALNHLLVAVAGGQKDGSSGIRDDQGAFVARRQSIEALADIVFTSNRKQADFWSGRSAADTGWLERVYGGLKLCLHGSDAHDPTRLGMPDEDRFCWLNGDPTFDTLKLACLSPVTRSHIGAEPPSSATKHGRITSVHLHGAPWFLNGTVELNPGLVAVIGARGSGKTALADFIAAGAGSAEPFDNERSFVSRAGQLLDETLAAVDWSHGEQSQCDFGAGRPPEAFVRPVRYLSQQFVERLCASDGVSDELLDEIERVIFEAWPIDQRQGADSFRELLDIRLGAARHRQAQQLESVLDLSDQITAVRLRKRKIPALEKELAELEARLNRLNGKIAELTKNADRKSADRLNVVSAALRTRQDEHQLLDRRQTALTGLQEAVLAARSTTFPRFVERLKEEYSTAGLDAADWSAFELRFADDVDEVLQARLRANRQAMAVVVGTSPAGETDVNLDGLTSEQLALEPLSKLAADEARLRGLVGLDEVRSKTLSTLTEQAGTTSGRIEKLKGEIAQAKSEVTGDLVARRLAHYEAYFEALLAAEIELRRLYAPLAEVLDGFGASVAKLKFAVRRDVDVDSWAQHGETLLDLRHEGVFRGDGAIRAVARRDLAEAWRSGDAAAAASAIGSFVAEHSDEMRRRPKLSGDTEEALEKWEHEISRWLYRTDHIQLRYDLQYDGLGIERLSPGTRGIVLLLLYLAVDQQERDPLIIDQPEENLDPESIYSELVTLFRTASERRQIIMVTHNANLVVNTDVDQVVVAHCGSLADRRLPDLSYQAGGLESPAIRSAVCDVLEGGAEAFRQRARRLGLYPVVPTPAPSQRAED